MKDLKLKGGYHSFLFILEYVRHKKYEKSSESGSWLLGRFMVILRVKIWFFSIQTVRKKQLVLEQEKTV